jgi:hypothetical protein
VNVNNTSDERIPLRGYVPTRCRCGSLSVHGVCVQSCMLILVYLAFFGMLVLLIEL